MDCDVLQADGGTRTASICGGYVALHDAITRLVLAGTIREHALSDLVAAVSVGVVGGVAMLDLPYEEDVRADTDMNVVMTGSGRFVEVQGTAEQRGLQPRRAQSAVGPGGARHRAHQRRPARRARHAARPRRGVTTFVLATANPHKARGDARSSRWPYDVELLARPRDVPEVDETEATLSKATRCLKARALAAPRPGYPAIADDTGLFIDALEGRPGVLQRALRR